jgi:phospholipid N-methyltransferase
MIHQYDVTAEFHDVLTVDHANMIGATLPALLAEVDPAAGPVVDLGAGTGLVTEAIARILPTARIVAVEPARAMRTALVTRLASAGLLEQVTVRATSATDDNALPQRIGGLTAFAMLGHLGADDRAALWLRLVDRLAPNAPAIIQALPPHDVEAVPLTRFDVVRWLMSYRVIRGDEVVREEHADYTWHPVRPDDVVSEAAAAGLRGERSGQDVVVLRR